MPDRDTIKRVRKDAQEGKSASTQAGEFVREEIEHVREGKHGARSAKQAIVIGLSKARRAGVKLAQPDAGEDLETNGQESQARFGGGEQAAPAGQATVGSDDRGA